MLLLLALLSVTLVQNAQAYYNPSTGRWLSRDPIEEAGGLNVHAMVDNSPINHVDVKGLLLRDTFLECGKKLSLKTLDKYVDQLFVCGALNSRLRGEKPGPGETESFDVDLCKGFSFRPTFEPEYTPTSLAKDIRDCVLSSLKSKTAETLVDELKKITDPGKKKILSHLLEDAADNESEAAFKLLVKAKCVNKKLHVTVNYSASVSAGGESISADVNKIGPFGCPKIQGLESECACCK